MLNELRMEPLFDLLVLITELITPEEFPRAHLLPRKIEYENI